jgi:serine protease AprX
VKRKRASRKRIAKPRPKREVVEPAVKGAAAGKPVTRWDFRFDLLSRLVLEPLFAKIRDEPRATYDVIIQLNEEFIGGREAARQEVRLLLGERGEEEAGFAPGYIFQRMTGDEVIQLLKDDNDTKRRAARARKYGKGEEAPAKGRGAASKARLSPRTRAIYKVSLDHLVRACLTKSLITIKADAAHRAFDALGRDIVWAVLDTGIDRRHPHLKDNLGVKSPVEHFAAVKGDDPLKDEHGHGTHVAGIIAGSLDDRTAQVARELLIDPRSDVPEIKLTTQPVGTISGVAPKTTLVSFKVLNSEGEGKVSDLLRAIDRIQQINDFGRRLLIHGANMSLGYEFNARWFGAGQSPLCVEVDRLVRSGVAVVVAAGNTGYGERLDSASIAQPGFLPISINDPGNSDQAITVGSTHREMPHAYGVSYFSSRGPTADGRMKPDLVAPGERIVSCIAGAKRRSLESQAGGRKVLYAEDSGTSMAAPHVSGAIAAFLSVHTEFIGKPWRVKEVFLAAATDLKRERYFQGAGLVDLMRSLQAV